MARRESLQGCWILDKTKEPWSMNKYLETMLVDKMAIEAHEKGEKEHDTYHTIEFLVGNRIRITKRSRVNNDLVVELVLGKEQVEYLVPGNRPKRALAHSDHPGHLCIQWSLQTVNGNASVTDTKRLENPEGAGDGNDSNNPCHMVQELTVVNEQTGQKHTTVRYFVPYLEMPPHLVPAPDPSTDPSP
jgi:hypothetical protein